MDNLSYRGRYRDKSDDDVQASMPYRPRRTAQKYTLMGALHSIHYKAILLSFLCWIVVVNFLERSTVRRTLQKCDWSIWEEWKTGSPHRVALFADPQIMDAYSYPGRPRLVNWAAQKIIDNYHKRNWAFVDSVLDPDSVIFLGDLFDGGRSWDDKDWFQEFKRFNEIYYQKPNRRTIMSLPGNHDIGFGEAVNVTSLQRFSAIFGPTSSTHDLGNHTIVLLDTISLSDFDNPEVMAGPRQVLESLAPYGENQPPRILMSHVPLYRFPDKQKCGPLRESKKDFPIMKGIQYQTVLDHELSKEVLAKVRPKIVFSGDDHDYCHVTHPYEFKGNQYTADEITVKSCSMNMGIQYPAIQLLSLNTEDEGATFKTTICYLPAPYTALKTYILSGVLNVVLFALFFVLPQSWNKIMLYLPSKRDRLSLPIAENARAVVVREGDYVTFFVNGLITAIGVLFVFGVYYNAF